MAPSLPEHDGGAAGPAGGDASPSPAVRPSPSGDDVANDTNGANDFGAATGALQEEEEEEEYQTSYARSAALSKKPRRRRGGYGASSLEAAPSKSGGAPATNGRLVGSPGNDEDDFGLVLGLGLDVEEEAPSSGIFLDAQDNDDESDGEGGSEAEESEAEAAGSDSGSVGDDESGEDGSEDEVDARPTGRRKRTTQAKKEVVAAREEEEECPPSEASGCGFGLGEGRALRAREDRAEEEATEEQTEEPTDEKMDAEAMDAEVAALEAEGAAAEEAPEADADELADGAPAPEATPAPAPPGRCPPTVPEPTSNAELLALVDRLFLAVTDRDAMTVGDVNRSVAAHYGWAPDAFKKKERKPLKKAIKARLTALITGEARAGDGAEEKKKEGKSKKKEKKVEPQSEEIEEPFGDDYESAPEENDDNSSDYEEEAPKKVAKKKKRGTKSASFDGDADASDEDEDDTPKRTSKKRSSRSKHKGKMAAHLRDRHAKARKRQREEARIRREELGHLAADDAPDAAETVNFRAAPGPRVAAPTEEDQRRAVAIARRFDTERDELRAKRAEEREGLIDRLRAKRLESIEAVEIRVEVQGEKVEAEEKKDAPRLTFGTGSGDNAKDEAPEEKPEEGGAKKKTPRVLDDDSSDEEGGDDDALEIAAPSSEDAAPSAAGGATHDPKAVKAKVSVEDLLSGHPSARLADPQRASKAKIVDPRAALRSALTARKVRQGNQLLAQELGLGMTGDEHLRWSRRTMAQKQTEARALQQRLNAAEARKRKAGAEDEALRAERFAGESTAIAAADEARALEALGIRRETTGEEDDELAMAAKMGLLAEAGDAGDEEGEEKEGGEDKDAEAPPETEGGGEDNKPQDDDDDKAQDDAPSVSSAPEASAPGSVVTPSHGPEASNEETAEETPESADGSPAAEDGLPGIVLEAKEDGGSAPTGEEKNETVGHNNNDESLEAEDAGNEANPSSKEEPAKDEAPADEEAEFEEPDAEETGPKKPRNSRWRAELEKEKRREARQQRLKRKGGGLVEGEAEEDEDDALGMAGLEDFGFTLAEKKDDDDDDAADDELDADDLDAVVDDVSDGEGDEAAGEAARQKQQRKEEKERHKEIMRRMKEGYDGRRGGIGRSNLRFDQLVEAENKAEAKRLGLANDDDYGSEDEEEGAGGTTTTKKDGDEVPEEEDEAAFLDKMLKDRFLHRGEEEAIEENFTDDEDSDDEAADGPADGAADDEDRAQDRAARHFAKRARRNRILEEFEGESGFSRSRLIDEDASTRQDLKSMRTSFARKRSVEGSNLDAKENNGASKKPKGASAGSLSDASTPASTFLASGGSLSVALAASRRGPGRKRKTTFLGGKAVSASVSRSHGASSSSRSVSLSHVVFVSGESQGAATSQLPEAGSHLGKSRGPKSKKASRSGSSLWSKVCSKNFRAN